MNHQKTQTPSADERITSLYRKRDEAAIRETDRVYGKFLFRIAYNILHDREEAEECRNDAYLAVWNAIPPAEPVSFSAFLTAIVRRIAINRYHTLTAGKRIPSEMTVCIDELSETLQSEASAEETAEKEILGSLINSFVKELPERQRFVFIERFYLSEPVERIAEEFSVSVPTVYRELNTVKSKLKEHLERNGIRL